MKKSNDREMLMSRRAFIRQTSCAALGITGLVNTLAHLTLTRAALAQTTPATDYKALVVLFLYGGNDSNNMLVPRLGHPGYTDYKTSRGVLGILDPNDPAYVAGRPASIPLASGGQGLGLHPSLQPLANLFAAGELAFVANVGTLGYPLTRAQYQAGTVPIPIQLFSHSDQQIEWQSSVADKPFVSGWGGRVADLLKQAGYAGDKVSLSLTMSGINSLQVGSEVTQYSVGPNGAVELSGYGTGYSSGRNADGTYRTNGTGVRLKAFDEITAYTHQHLLEEGYNQVVRSARASEALIGTAFTAAAASGVDIDALFAGATTSLGTQLRTIAKLIAGRNSLDNRRRPGDHRGRSRPIPPGLRPESRRRRERRDRRGPARPQQQETRRDPARLSGRECRRRTGGPLEHAVPFPPRVRHRHGSPLRRPRPHPVDLRRHRHPQSGGRAGGSIRRNLAAAFFRAGCRYSCAFHSASIRIPGVPTCATHLEL